MSRTSIIIDGGKLRELIEKKRKLAHLSLKDICEKELKIDQRTLRKALDSGPVAPEIVRLIAEYLHVSEEDITASPDDNMKACRRALEKDIKSLGDAECSALWSQIHLVVNKTKTVEEILRQPETPEKRASRVMSYITGEGNREGRSELLRWIEDCDDQELDKCYDGVMALYDKVAEEFLDARSKVNMWGYRKLEQICQNMLSNPMYVGNMKEKELPGIVTYHDEGEGAYMVYLPIPPDMMKEFGIEDEIYIDDIEGEKGSREWQEHMHQAVQTHIEDRLGEAVNDGLLNEDSQEELSCFFYSNIDGWEFEEISENDEDSQKAGRFVRAAYEKLFIAMSWSGDYENIGRVLSDMGFAREMFTLYGMEPPF